MGKLAELWAELKALDRDDPHRLEIQKKINEVESWMISKGYKKDGITQWHRNNAISDSYPHNSGAVFIEDLDQLKEFQNVN